MTRFRIGIDLGGTKIEGIALAPDGTAAETRRIPSPRGSYSATLDAIADLVAQLRRGASTEVTVGIGIPGSVAPDTGLVQGANSTWLNGRPLGADIAAQLGLPVRLANDANCFALSEAVDGAAAGARSVFGVIVGTGCGGGIVFERRLIDGPNAIGGEWGHNPLPWPRDDEHPGPRCWCGRNGCMETWIAGPGLAADHGRVTGQMATAEAIAARAATGDPDAAATLARHADRFARGLAHVINIVDPHVIVLGGGLSKMSALYTALPALTARHVFARTPIIDIRPPRWGDSSGVRGAAWLWE